MRQHLIFSNGVGLKGFTLAEEGGTDFVGLPDIPYASDDGTELTAPTGIAISGDGQWMVVGTAPTAAAAYPYRLMLYRRSGDTWERVGNVDTGGSVNDVSISNNGGIIAIANGSATVPKLWKRDGNNLVAIADSTLVALKSSISPDGKWWVRAASTASLQGARIENDGTLTALTFPGLTYANANTAATISPDSKYVVVRHTTGNLTYIYELAIGVAVLRASLGVRTSDGYFYYRWEKDFLWLTGFTSSSTRSPVGAKLTFDPATNTLTQIATGTTDGGATTTLFAGPDLMVDGGRIQVYQRSGGGGLRWRLITDNGAGALAYSLLSGSPTVSGSPIVWASSPDLIEGVASLYDVGVLSIVSGEISFASMKLALLSNAALFDNTDAVFNDVIAGGVEVVTQDWAAGGVAVGNFRAAMLSGEVAVTADNIVKTILQEELNFRCAVFYDNVTKKPLMFVDFGNVQTVVAGEQLTIKAQPDGLIIFDR